MPDERLRSQLADDLKDALLEVARLSEMIAVLRASHSHSVDEDKLNTLSAEWTAANARATALRREMQAAAGDEAGPS
jgi:hypothetical protein